MRKRYLKDYDAELTYKGTLYTVQNLTFWRVKLSAMAVAMVVLYVAMGLTGIETTRDFRVGIPYALLAVALFLLNAGTFRFVTAPTEFHRCHYEGAFLPLAVHGAGVFIWGMVLCVMGILTAPVGEGWFSVLAGGMVITAVLFVMEWRKVKGGIVAGKVGKCIV
jgi:hypothetical protein